MTAKKASKKAAGKPKLVVALVNGQTTGSCEPTGSIFEASQKLAAAHGIKGYSIKVDGKIIKAEAAGKPLAGHKSIEIFAKDTRG